MRYDIETEDFEMGDLERLSMCLDDDMRLIFPEMYVRNQKLYDKICDIGYLIQDVSNPNKELDWVSGYQLDRVLHNNPSIIVISKMLIVSLRLPWHEINTEWLCTEEQLKEQGNPNDYEILETYVRAKRKDENEIRWIFPPEKQYFDEHRDEYEVVEVKYCVRWSWTEEDIKELLDNPYETKAIVRDKNNIHTYISV